MNAVQYHLGIVEGFLAGHSLPEKVNTALAALRSLVNAAHTGTVGRGEDARVSFPSSSEMAAVAKMPSQTGSGDTEFQFCDMADASTPDTPRNSQHHKPSSAIPVEGAGDSNASTEIAARKGQNPANLWEIWQLEKLQQLKREGAVASEIAAAVNKTATQVNNKWTWLRIQERKAAAKVQPGAQTESNPQEVPEFIGKRQKVENAVWYPDDWGDIQAMLSRGTSVKTIAGDYGVTFEQIEAFIKQNSDRAKAPEPGESAVLEEAPNFNTYPAAMRSDK